MCSSGDALIEPGKTKTSSHFTLTMHNHLCLRFTVLSPSTKPFSVFLLQIYVMHYFHVFLNHQLQTVSFHGGIVFLLQGIFLNGTSVRLIVKNFNYFLYKIVLFLLFLF